MEILLWLAPSVVVAVLAMAWVAWLGREEKRPDRDAAVRRMGEALGKQPETSYAVRQTPQERSTGVAVRGQRKAG